MTPTITLNSAQSSDRFFFGLGSSSALLPPGSTATSLADAGGLLYYLTDSFYIFSIETSED
jgi:hypothetical protein